MVTRFLTLILLMTIPGSAYAQEEPGYPRRMFLVSVGVHAAGAGLDAYSSWHYAEANPVLANGRNGRFDARGAAICAGLLAGMTGVEWLAIRASGKNPRVVRFVSGVNCVMGLTYGVAAARNFAVRRRMTPIE
jgi:hypothetical protein